MRTISDIVKNIVPKRNQPQVDYSEFIALRTVVMVILAELANEYETSGAGKRQEWLNRILAICSETIVNANITANNKAEVDLIRAAMLKNMNSVFWSVTSPRQGDKAN